MRMFDESLETAFQLATLRGPLCAEPMMGMAFYVEKMEVQSDEASKETRQFLSLCLSRISLQPLCRSG
jgi:ribosome assembly protein 1